MTSSLTLQACAGPARANTSLAPRSHPTSGRVAITSKLAVVHRASEPRSQPRGAPLSAVARDVSSQCIADFSAGTRAADLSLTTKDGKQIHVFGVNHLVQETHVGEFILDTKPAVVVVETAIHPEHGLNTGNIAKFGDEVEGLEGMFLQQFTHIAGELRKAEVATESDMWRNMVGAINGEQLAYVCAFTVDADVMFGDRPKHITYKRLANMPTLLELDESFAASARSNYEELIAGFPPPAAPDADNCFDRIMMLERETCMAHAMHVAAAKAPEGGSVVAVVGSDHLPGIAAAWDAGRQDFKIMELMDTPEPDSSLSPAEHGARRGLLEALMALRVPQQVLMDLNGVVGMPPEGQMETLEQTVTTYGHPRMLLASQDKEFLAKVCSGCAGLDMYENLAKLRSVRPSHGGKGYDAEALDELLCMAYDFSAYGDPKEKNATAASE